MTSLILFIASLIKELGCQTAIEDFSGFLVRKSGACWDWKPKIHRIGRVGKYACAKKKLYMNASFKYFALDQKVGLSSQPMHTWITLNL